MEKEENKQEKPVGEMRKQTETMADGKRYIIFYTFGGEEKQSDEVKKNV